MRRANVINRLAARVFLLFLLFAVSSCTEITLDTSKAFTRSYENYQFRTPLSISNFSSLIDFSQKATWNHSKIADSSYKWRKDTIVCADCNPNRYQLFFLGKKVKMPLEGLRRIADSTNIVVAAEDFYCFDEFGDTTNYSFIKGTPFSQPQFIELAKKDDFPMAEVKDELSNRTFKIPELFVSSYIDTSAVRTILRAAYENHTTILDTLLQSAVVKPYATVNGKPIAVCVEFFNGARLTFISAPFIFTNYIIASDCGKPASLVSNLTINALGAENVEIKKVEKEKEQVIDETEDIVVVKVEEVDETEDIEVVEEDEEKEEDEQRKQFVVYTYPEYYDGKQTYVAPLDNDKKKGTPMSNGSRDTERKSIFWEILKTFWPFLLIFLPLLGGRRKRAVPIIDWFTNKSAGYIKHIGKLYQKEGDWQLILQNKITYFANDMKERLGVEILDKEMLDSNAELLAQVSGEKLQSIKSFLININNIKSGRDVTLDMLMRLSDKMVEISSKVNGKVEVVEDKGMKQDIKVEIEKIDSTADLQELANSERTI